MNSDLLKLLGEDEVIEPETLSVFPELEDTLDRQTIQVIHLLRTARAPYEDLDVFENVVAVLNGIIPEVDVMEGSTPEFIWKAVDYIKKIHPNAEFSHEVKQYIKYIFNDNGYWFYPPGLGLPNARLDSVKALAEIGPFPLRETYMGIQAIRYLKIMHYLEKEGE